MAQTPNTTQTPSKPVHGEGHVAAQLAWQIRQAHTEAIREDNARTRASRSPEAQVLVLKTRPGVSAKETKRLKKLVAA